jgi:hypothetical protein
LPAYRTKKGFLAQAKRVEPGETFERAEFNRLSVQCKKMLEFSPDSFVFLYARSRISVLPAISMLAADPCNPHELYARSVARFYEEHFQSFIGDQAISAPTPDALEQLQRRLDTPRLLYLGVLG